MSPRPAPVTTVPVSARAPVRTPAGSALPAPPPVQALTLSEPLPGFPGDRDYVLVAAEASGRLCWLQSVAPEGPRFLAASAADWFPDYAPVLPVAARAELGLDDTAQAHLYCLVTVPDGDVMRATANLRAPVVVNTATARARQVALADGGHPIRRPLRR